MEIGDIERMEEIKCFVKILFCFSGKPTITSTYGTMGISF
jgi:hypothetical protein